MHRGRPSPPPGASSLNEVQSDLIQGIRCSLSGRGGEVGGECMDRFTRGEEKKEEEKKNERETWHCRPALRADTRDEMFWSAHCYYPSGCYCTKPRTDNEMMYMVFYRAGCVCVCVRACACTCNSVRVRACARVC